MDYETKPTNRNELRLYAKLFRSICGFSVDEPIDPIVLLDRLPELEGFEDVRYGDLVSLCILDSTGEMSAHCFKELEANKS